MEATRKTSTVQIMSEIGLMAATGFILDYLASVLFKGLFPNGGSISIAMIAVLIIAFRRGFLPALGVGLIMGAFDFLKGPFMIAATPDKVFFQVILDYIIAYPLVSVAGFFKKPFDKASGGARIKWLILGVLAGGTAKFLSHYLSGIIFWADPSGFAWDLTWMNPYVYCLLYNVAYCVPSMVLSGLLLVLMYKRAPMLFLVKRKGEESERVKNVPVMSLSLVTAAAGVALFTVFLVRYIQSFAAEDYGPAGIDVSFDKLSLNVMVIGLVWLITSMIAFFNAMKSYDWRIFPFSIVNAAFLSSIASIANLIKVLQKGPADPWIYVWLVLSLVVFIGGTIYMILKYRKVKNAKNEVAQAGVEE